MIARSDVFLVRGDRNEPPERLGEIAETLYRAIRPEDGLTEPVVIKVHVGEISDKGEIKTHTRPELVASFIHLLKKDGIREIVLADSTVNYAGAFRSTPEGHMEAARRHGFTELGVPFVVADKDGYDTIGNKRFGQIEIPALFSEIGDRGGSALVLSHFKGHEIFAFGGALKNRGMGFVGRSTKADIHHFKAEIDSAKCQGCGKCVTACTHGAINCNNDGIAYVNPNRCLGCFMCLDSCQDGALSMTMGDLGDIDIPESKDRVGRYITDSLIIAAEAVVRPFKPGHLLYVTDLTKITTYCDCDVGARLKIMEGGHPEFLTEEDIGFLASTDPVALDQACIDLVKAQIGEEAWHKRLSIFPFYFPVALTRQIEKAVELGMGNKDYNLREIT